MKTRNVKIEGWSQGLGKLPEQIFGETTVALVTMLIKELAVECEMESSRRGGINEFFRSRIRKVPRSKQEALMAGERA